MSKGKELYEMSEYELRMEYNRLCDEMKNLLEIADLGNFDSVYEIEPYRRDALEVHRQYKMLYWQNEKENLEKRKEEYKYKDTFDLEVSIKTYCKSILETLERIYKDLKYKFGSFSELWTLDGCAGYDIDIKCVSVKWQNVVYMLDELNSRNVIKLSSLWDRSAASLEYETATLQELYGRYIDYAIDSLKIVVDKKVREGSMIYNEQTKTWFLMANSYILDLENVNEHILAERQE